MLVMIVVNVINIGVAWPDSGVAGLPSLGVVARLARFRADYRG